MTELLHGDRLGKQGQIRLGCSAVIFDKKRNKVLLTLRSDNDLWCLPGGAVDPGESVSESCIREIFEETGLNVKIKRLAGIYSDPNQLVIYPDGKKVQIIALNFEVEVISGEPQLSKETREVGYFSIDAARELNMMGNHLERILDTVAEHSNTLLK